MPKIGDGFIEIHPDWSAFGAGFGEEVKARLRGVADDIKAKVKLDVDKGGFGDLSKIGRDIANTDFSSAFAGLRREVARPVEQKVKVDVDRDSFRGALARMRVAFAGAAQHIQVDVDRDSISRAARKITGGIGGALQGATAGVSGALSRIPVIGGLFQGLSSAFGTSALGAAAASAAIIGLSGVLAALAASLGAALLGLGALTVAFGAALGPAVLVAFAAIARFVSIVKAVKDHNDNASTSARGVAAANEQLAAASDAVAQAQTNVREQATAAYEAWGNAIETVKDDLLGVKDAQQGVTDANLTTREAQQALVNYQKEIRATGGAFDQVFKKFSDVNVDTSGLKKAFLNAADVSGVNLTDDQELKLERLVNNVRDAKLGEAHASDTLRDSKRKLNTDTKTENDFAERGIKAYKPYTAAVKQVTTANRQLAAAQRAQAGASERQTKAWDKLSPAEKKFGGVLIALGKTLSRVFTPAMDALLGGITRGLTSFSKAATDPKVGGALTETGKALGDAFASISKTLTAPEMRTAFVEFADAGAKIIKTFGTRVFDDLALILTRIARVTMPLLLPLLDKVADFFDGLEHSSRNTKNLRDDISGLVDIFKVWGGLIATLVDKAIDLGKFLEPVGTALADVIRKPSDANLDKFFDEVGKAAGTALRKIGNLAAKAAPRAAKAFVEAFKNAGIWGQLLTLAFISKKLGAFNAAGSAAGDLFVKGTKKAMGALKDVMVRIAARAGASAGAAAAGTEGLTSATSLGRFRRAGRLMGLAFGAAAAIAIGLELTKKLQPYLDALAQKAANLITGTSPEKLKADAERKARESHAQAIKKSEQLGGDAPWIDSKGRIHVVHAPTKTLRIPDEPRRTGTSGGSAPHAPSGRTFDTRGVVVQQADIHVSAPAAAVPDGRFTGEQILRELQRTGG